MKIGKKIQEIRIEKGLTQEALARKANISFAGLNRIENGHVPKPQDSTLSVIARALGVSVNILKGE